MGEAAIRKRWTIKREALEKADCSASFARIVPKWAHRLCFGLYRELGWNANLEGKKVAAGKWGDELFLLSNGRIGCTEYPNGWSAEAAVEKGRLKWEAEKASLTTPNTGGSNG